MHLHRRRVDRQAGQQIVERVAVTAEQVDQLDVPLRVNQQQRRLGEVRRALEADRAIALLDQDELRVQVWLAVRALHDLDSHRPTVAGQHALERRRVERGVARLHEQRQLRRPQESQQLLKRPTLLVVEGAQDDQLLDRRIADLEAELLDEALVQVVAHRAISGLGRLMEPGGSLEQEL